MSISKKKARNILEEIYQTANHATLTGALSEGALPLAMAFNKIKELAIKNGWIEAEEADLVDILPQGADEDMCKVGTAARLFAAILEDEEALEAPETAETPEAKEWDANGYEITN